MPSDPAFRETMQQDYDISNAGGLKIGSIAQDRASNCWWIMGNVERFRSEPDAFGYWLANYDHETGVLREPDPPAAAAAAVARIPELLPSYLE